MGLSPIEIPVGKGEEAGLICWLMGHSFSFIAE